MEGLASSLLVKIRSLKFFWILLGVADSFSRKGSVFIKFTEEVGLGLARLGFRPGELFIGGEIELLPDCICKVLVVLFDLN